MSVLPPRRYASDRQPLERGRAARNIRAAVRTALPLRKRLDRRVPCRRAEPRGVIHRDADPIPELGVADVVLGTHHGPLAGQIDLSGRWSADRQHREERNDDSSDDSSDVH